MAGCFELRIGNASTLVGAAVLALAIAAALLLTPVVAHGAPPPLGGLTQLSGSAACVSLGGAAGCATGKALDQPSSVALSPDGKHAYIAATRSDAVVVMVRDGATGGLTQVAGTGGCVSEDGTAGACTDGVGLNGPRAVVTSPDGLHVYVLSSVSNAITAFKRAAATGALTQLEGVSACISEDGTGGACTDGTALDALQRDQLAISPDGKHLYAATGTSDAIVALVRDPATGALTQLPGLDGCVSEDGTGGLCADGVALDGAQSVMVAPDGAHVYAWSRVSDAVSVFARDPVSGRLAQLAAPDGCVSLTGTGGACGVGTAIDGPGGLTISPDGAHVYVATRTASSIAVFTRDVATGKLTQLAGSDGCVSDDGSGGACTDGTALSGVRGGLAVSADGKSLYAAAQDADAVAIFGRDPSSGRLTQLAGAFGCVSEDGTAGACTDATALNFPQSAVVSGDGKFVYVTSELSDAVAAFSRQLPPTCRSTSVTVPRGGKAYVHLACTDPNGDPITRTVVSQPLNGQLSALDETRNTVSYTPSRGFTGNDAITYSASDGGATSAVATISLRVVAPGSARARQLRCNGRAATIVGSSVGDNIRGTKGRDVVVARGGDDVVHALGGNDVVCLGAGDDIARGGIGNDFLSGGAGDDLLRGLAGRDVVTGGSGNDRLEGGPNNDRLFGGPGLDFLIGNGGRDRLIAGSGSDRLLGGRGNDVLRGGPGNDRGIGGPGQDTCTVERPTSC